MTPRLAPIVLSANQPPRFYRGGTRIARFRGGTHEADACTPEDWVASVVNVRGDDLAGMTRLPDGRLLRDAIANDPRAWLGDAHLERYGPDPMLLVKLLDAGQRLPVHAHPDDEFAASRLGAAHGKAEAWHILTGGTVHLGLVRDIRPEDLHAMVGEQDVDSMLSLLHHVEVHPGDRVFVPPGALHAVGEDVLLVEVQEPEDLSILLEWRDFDIDGAASGHLGLGFGAALEGVDLRRMTTATLSQLILRADASRVGLPQNADPHFRLDCLSVDGLHALPTGFAVIIGVEGELALGSEPGEETAHAEQVATTVVRGSTVLVPAASAPAWLSGRGQILLARPPAS